MLHERTSTWSKLLVTVGIIVYIAILAKPLTDNDQLDLYVYVTGAKLGLEGMPPYITPVFQMRVAEKFPPKNDDDFANNCGFFLPPQGIAFFAPLAKRDWDSAQIFWVFVLTAFAVVCGTLAWTFGRAPAYQGTGWALVVLAVLLNPITQPALIVGQYGLMLAGCIALGQYCFENGSPRFGCFLWSILFLKPHLALPFLALAWVLGGWRRVAGIAIFVALWNLFGGLIATGSIEGAVKLFRLWFEYVGASRGLVRYNLVAANYQITSWNRIIAASGGPAIDLTALLMLGGFAAWGILIVFRLRLGGPLSRERLDPAYLLAAAVVAALFFAQVLAYEMILLILFAPLILQTIDDGRRGSAYLFLGLILFLLIPMNLMDQLADRFGLADESRGRTLLRSHKCFGMALLALALLVRGPRKAPAEPTQLLD